MSERHTFVPHDCEYTWCQKPCQGCGQPREVECHETLSSLRGMGSHLASAPPAERDTVERLRELAEPRHRTLNEREIELEIGVRDLCDEVVRLRAEVADPTRLDGALGGWITKIGRTVGLAMDGHRCSEVWEAVCKMQERLDTARRARSPHY